MEFQMLVNTVTVGSMLTEMGLSLTMEPDAQFTAVVARQGDQVHLFTLGNCRAEFGLPQGVGLNGGVEVHAASLGVGLWVLLGLPLWAAARLLQAASLALTTGKSMSVWATLLM
jgi:hypothetical protein